MTLRLDPIFRSNKSFPPAVLPKDNQYDVTPLKSYYSFIYFTTAEPPESLEMRCDFPLSEWQSLLCANTGSLSRRE